MTASLLVAGSAVIARAPSAADPYIAADAAPVALLVDLGAGQELYEKSADRVFLPASMTKAMTTLIAFDLIASGKLREDAVLSVRPETAAVWAGKGTSLYLKPAMRVTVRELLLGVTTASANDAAVVLAEGVAGSVEQWAALMNARARALEMTHSRFATPNGWPDGGRTQVSARDLVKLARALITEHPALYARYVGHPALTWNGATFRNHDPFAGTVSGADGIKTGHTTEAGYNFLGSVQRDGRRLVVVVGGAASEAARATSARELIEWGYSAWQSHPLAATNALIGTAEVQNGAERSVALTIAHPLAIAVRKGRTARLSSRIVYNGPLVAPIRKNAEVAKLELRVDDGPVLSIPLVAAQGIGRAGPFDRLVNGLLGLLS